MPKSPAPYSLRLRSAASVNLQRGYPFYNGIHIASNQFGMAFLTSILLLTGCSARREEPVIVKLPYHGTKKKSIRSSFKSHLRNGRSEKLYIIPEHYKGLPSAKEMRIQKAKRRYGSAKKGIRSIAVTPKSRVYQELYFYKRHRKHFRTYPQDNRKPNLQNR